MIVIESILFSGKLKFNSMKYTRKDLHRALEDMSNGLSRNDAATKYNIPYGTLGRYTKEVKSLGKTFYIPSKLFLFVFFCLLICIIIFWVNDPGIEPGTLILSSFSVLLSPFSVLLSTFLVIFSVLKHFFSTFKLSMV